MQMYLVPNYIFFFLKMFHTLKLYTDERCHIKINNAINLLHKCLPEANFLPSLHTRFQIEVKVFHTLIW